MSIVRQYTAQVSTKHLCQWLMLPRSIYYYSPTKGEKGIKPSTVTKKGNGEVVSNAKVVDDIKTILSGEFVNYGYQNVTVELKNMGYIINHKKVYRLMDEYHLLLGKVIRTQGKREWVKYRKITAEKPMEYLCWDIKYVWVPGERKNYYLLTILDVYTRKVIDWIFQGSIRKVDVIKLLSRVDLSYGLKGVSIRNDNGSQFIANKVRSYLRNIEARQEFTHIATPEENSYIEAFHSIFQRDVIDRFEFASFYEAKLTIAGYMNHYNNKRLHGAIGRITPQQKWNEYYFSLSSDKPLSAKVSEEMSRVPGSAGTGLALDIFGDTAIFAYRMMNEKTVDEDEKNLNCFEKPVQFIGG